MRFSISREKVLLALAIGQLGLQLLLLLQGVDHLVVSHTIDDTYYYLLTAWNTSKYGFPTFDGINPTNGVQLLWFWIVTLVSFIAPTKHALLMLTLAICFLFNALCYLPIWNIGKTLQTPTTALFIACLWMMQILAPSTSYPSYLYGTGMENSLHAFVFWCVAWQVIVWVVRVECNEPPNLTGLTLALVFNVWVRLDSAIFSGMLYLFCIGLLAARRREQLRQYARSVGVATLLAGAAGGVQMATYWIMGKTIIPISALVKSTLPEPRINLTTLQNHLLVSVPELPFVAFLLALIALAISIQGIARTPHTTETRAFRTAWFLLFSSGAIYLLFTVVTFPPGAIYLWRWYLSPLYIIWIITIAFAAHTIARMVQLRRQIPAQTMVTGCLVAIILSALFRFSEFVTTRYPPDTLYAVRYRSAQWIATHSPPDAIYAALNAGQLGYFSNRPVINLDGLINSRDYYEEVLRSDDNEALKAYLATNGVDYFVDYQTIQPVEGQPIVKTFPGDKDIHIWDLP
jgi:hypothetical protein